MCNSRSTGHKKMKLAILGSPNSWYFKDLSRACEDRHEIVCLPFSRLMSNTMPGETNISSRGVSLDTFDAVIVRSMPAGSLEQVVFRMDALQHLEQSGTKVLNPPKSLEIAIDKFLTLAKLQRSGLNVPRTIVCQTVEESMEAFITFDGDVVVTETAAICAYLADKYPEKSLAPPSTSSARGKSAKP